MYTYRILFRFLVLCLSHMLPLSLSLFIYVIIRVLYVYIIADVLIYSCFIHVGIYSQVRSYIHSHLLTLLIPQKICCSVGFLLEFCFNDNSRKKMTSHNKVVSCPVCKFGLSYTHSHTLFLTIMFIIIIIPSFLFVP